ncbi:hypothetical protein D1O30_21230 [Methylocystis hirsuta]|uniref:Transmembrane protein n=2 Tax=Methylocystis hirsuta TaxID=369798 RepID=A0A3M9XIN7_9HYPH|nr:hypothetical protein D1O30_21230 [Methylocystis hirsuta]
MRKNFKSGVAGALCGVLALSTMPAEVVAGPMGMASPADMGFTSPIETIHYRRHRHRHYVRYYHPRRYYRRGYAYRYDPAGAIFAATALGIMGAGIAAATAPRYYGWGYPYGGWGWGYPVVWGYPYGGWGW